MSWSPAAARIAAKSFLGFYAEALGQKPETCAGSYTGRISDQCFEPIIGDRVDHFFLNATGLPSKQQIAEMIVQCFPTGRVEFLFISESAEAQAARSQPVLRGVEAYRRGHRHR